MRPIQRAYICHTYGGTRQSCYTLRLKLHWFDLLCFCGKLYIYNSSVSILLLIGQRSYAAMGMPGCQLDTAALQRVRPLFCLQHYRRQPSQTSYVQIRWRACSMTSIEAETVHSNISACLFVKSGSCCSVFQSGVNIGKCCSLLNTLDVELCHCVQCNMVNWVQGSIVCSIGISRYYLLFLTTKEFCYSHMANLFWRLCCITQT